MTTCVFVGPTLSAAEVRDHPEIVYLPPVAQGDVLRAVRRHAPRAIGIVDGLFGGAPAVWHKEILWALSEGVAVFGSASMGALRAAELHGYGMQGIGRIFESYRDGQLEDDDEVAVIHGPAELGYPALSEPMVNIRATLARAEAEAMLGAAARAVLEADAKARPFPERSWPALLDRLAELDGAPARARFEGWLATGRVDRKREDALAMLGAMRIAAARPPSPFRFAATHHWDALVARVSAASENEEDGTGARVMDELRLGPQELFRAMRDRALLQRSVLADPLADAGGSPEESLRTTLGLPTRRSLEAWVAANDLTSGGASRLARRAHDVDAALRRFGDGLSPHLLDVLRLTGHYPGLAARARDKAAVLARHGRSPTAALAPGERMALRQWFAARRLDPATPDDLATLLEATGFADGAALDQALRRERIYLTLASPPPED